MDDDDDFGAFDPGDDGGDYADDGWSDDGGDAGAGDDDDAFGDDDPAAPGDVVMGGGGVGGAAGGAGAAGAGAGQERKSEEYVSMAWEGLGLARREAEDSVAEMLGLSRAAASMLLRCNRWDQERVLHDVVENREATLARAGLAGAALAPAPAAGSPAVYCAICADTVPAESTASLGCGHAFCRDCWDRYLQDKVSQGTEAVRTRCPEFKCPVKVTDDVVAALLTPPEARARYERSVGRSFVDDSRDFKWCPAPRCERAVRASSAGVTSVRCACGNPFCFGCDEESHAPATCDMLQAWLEKCRDESETAHWIIVNTRKCPICKVRIEKNQGCNHMICRSCKHEFCWVCMGSWAEHGNHTGGYYKCNKYNPRRKAAGKGGKAAAAAAAAGGKGKDGGGKGKDGGGKDGKAEQDEDAKADLDYYLHYYQRYHNHDQSKRFAGRMEELTEQRMRALQENSEDSTWMDVQFLRDATRQVAECRRVLKYTYVFGYYLDDGPEKELFEFLQQELEKTTEQLSELSEQPLSDVDRAQVVNYTRVTQKFSENLLDGVARGLTHG